MPDWNAQCGACFWRGVAISKEQAYRILAEHMLHCNLNARLAGFNPRTGRRDRRISIAKANRERELRMPRPDGG